MLSRKKLFQQIQDDKSLTGIAFEVFEILHKKDGLTAGEVFLAYQIRHPDTSRSRNEIAKRVSDLVNYGVVRRAGTTVCPLTGKTVSQYVLTGQLPNRQLALPVVHGNVKLATNVYAGIDVYNIAARDAHLSTLNALAIRSRFLLRFHKLLPSSLCRRASDTLSALEYAIRKLEAGE